MSAAPVTRAQALAHARQHYRLDAIDARVLLCAACGCTPTDLLAHPETPLDAAAAATFAQWCARRAEGVPVAYLVGGREFYGHWLRVSEDVLIPRPETELLVEQTLAAALPEDARVLDMGTGSGAVAISLALARARWQVWAVEQSREALTIAQANAARLNAAVRFVRSDWFAALPAGQTFHAIVANPPYVAEGDPHLSQGDVRFEPRRSLTAGRDGLTDLRHIVHHAPRWLAAGGCLWLEHGFDQSEAVRALLADAGFADVHSARDLAGIARVSGGRLPT